jgi:5-(carboxyamino)imidazole ribonucleotide synthase
VSELAIIGGGQLARMMTPAATALGIGLRLLAEGPDVSAAQVITNVVVGDHLVLDDLMAAVGDAPVVTFDHEHVPLEHQEALIAAGHACRPGPHALIYAHDKLIMRRRLVELGLPAPRWALCESAADVEAFGFPLILKTARGGYDGKGVWKVESPDDAADAWALHHATGIELIAEELVPFTRELSAQVARNASGEVVSYPVVESVQRHGVCAEVIAPAPHLDAALAAEAQRIARQIATELDVVGMLAVELFETSDGSILINELAMRPHNTGHWSIDGACTSQFENHVRAVLDLPLGATTPRQAWTVMVNVLGGSETDLVAARGRALAAEPDVKVHLYGKDVKPGRKVGHVSALGDDLDDVMARARRAAAILTDG